MHVDLITTTSKGAPKIIHGTENGKKTACGINLTKPENIGHFASTGEMSDVIESVRAVTLQGERKTLTASDMNFRYRYSMLQEHPLIVTQAVCMLRPGNMEEIQARMDELQQKRMEKQPLQYASAGSTFKRPDGAYAARLIDECGLRGTWVGGAQVSEKHAGFLLNRGGTAADFLALMDLVREKVQKETGFVLEPEVRILGTAGA